MVKWLKKLFGASKMQETISEEVIEEVENGPVKITSIYQYLTELEKGTTDFDFSELDFEFEDIQNVNLENLNLDINLRNVFVPYNGSCKCGNNVITSLFGSYSGDYYLKINKSRL